VRDVMGYLRFWPAVPSGLDRGQGGHPPAPPIPFFRPSACFLLGSLPTFPAFGELTRAQREASPGHTLAPAPNSSQSRFATICNKRRGRTKVSDAGDAMARAKKSCRKIAVRRAERRTARLGIRRVGDARRFLKVRGRRRRQEV
jgi:hypothetical protein